MKLKNLLLILFCFCLIFLTACESETEIRSAHISDITSARSTNYAIKVTLDDEERVKEKNVGLQIKSNQENTYVTFGEELKDTYTLYLPRKDYWYNLTYLISQINGLETEAGYLGYEEYGDRVFRFCADKDVKLTFRMVAGNTKQNQETGEEILVLSEPISDEVTVKMKKCDQRRAER